MIIKEMFSRDIDRTISGVIKASEADEKKVFQELDEYVVTQEIAKHLNKFYHNYSKGVGGETDKIGVWISGFFGSGKSHFLKILSYLLDNKQIEGKKAVEYLKNKVEDPLLYAEMERLAKVNSETILFNIDAKNPIGNKEKKDAILRIFIKVFNEHRGLCAEIPGVANLENELIERGVYEEFQEQFKAITGRSWLDRRNAFFLDRDHVAKAISTVLGISVESANEHIQKSVSEYEIDTHTLSYEVKKYVDSKGKDFHLIFLADEVGQFIGDNGELMLSLQTVAEELGTACSGRAWVMVTSQEAIDDLIDNIKGRDFSKIQGRFDTRLSLSSISVDEVIKKRILEKEENAKYLLKDLYREKSAILKNLISFNNARRDLLGYSDENEFESMYPFIPYQFKLVQNVFEQVRKHGSSGKHLSEGERSMLSAFKESICKYTQEEEGILIPFYAFYDTIQEFLNPSISRVIDRAEKHPELRDNPLNTQVLKLLFMIKYLADEIPANVENIATLMLTSIDQDKLQLKEDVKKALRKLCDETLIQKNGETYIFLTDDEQDVNREIKEEKIDDEKLKRELSKEIYQEIYQDPKYKYSKYNTFNFNKRMDEKEYGNQTSEITLNFLSALSDNYYKSEEQLILDSLGGKEIIFKLGHNESYIEELTEALKIESYTNKKNINTLPENIQMILTGKRGEMRLRKQRVRELLQDAIVQGTVYINGTKQDIKGGTPKEKISNAFNVLIDTIFNKLSYIKVNLLTEQELSILLKSTDEQLGLDENKHYDNSQAEQELLGFIRLEESNHKQIRMKILIDRFSKAPYGWNLIDIAGVVAKLFKQQKIRLTLSGSLLEISQTNKIIEALTKTAEVERVMINEVVKADPILINTIKAICLDVFSIIAFPDDENGVAIEIRNKIKEQIEEINGYLVRYEEKKYPGKSLFLRGLELLKEIQEHRDNISFFKAIQDKEIDLLNWVADISYTKGFFKSQKEIFDKGLELQNKCQNNKLYLTDALKEELDRLIAILTDPIPYAKIRNLAEINKRIQEGFEELFIAKKQESIEKIREDYEYCLLRASQEYVSITTKEKVEEAYESLLKDVELHMDLYRLDATITMSKNRRSALENSISKEIDDYRKVMTSQVDNNQGNSVVNENNTVPPKPKSKEVKAVEVASLVTIKSLKTEKEIDIYISELKNKLVAIIRQDKEIEIR